MIQTMIRNIFKFSKLNRYYTTNNNYIKLNLVNNYITNYTLYKTCDIITYNKIIDILGKKHIYTKDDINYCTSIINNQNKINLNYNNFKYFNVK